MKKVFATLMLLATIVGASAQIAGANAWVSQSFINPSVASIQVSNTLQFTNITAGSTYAASYPTNVAGLRYTNSMGVRVTVGSADYKPLVQDVELWPFLPSGVTQFITNAASVLGEQPIYVDVGILIEEVGDHANASVATTYIFIPVIDDTSEAIAASEANAITVSVTPSGTTKVVSYTPLNIRTYPKLIGAKKLRLVRVNNGETSDATHQVHIVKCALVGRKCAVE